MQSTLATNIKKRREELGISQGAVARQLGVTRSAVSLWESQSRSISLESLGQLAAALHTTPGELLGNMQLALDSELLACSLSCLDPALALVGTSLSNDKKAKVIGFIYAKGGNMPLEDVVALCRMVL